MHGQIIARRVGLVARTGRERATACGCPMCARKSLFASDPSRRGGRNYCVREISSVRSSLVAQRLLMSANPGPGAVSFAMQATGSWDEIPRTFLNSTCACDCGRETALPESGSAMGIVMPPAGFQYLWRCSSVAEPDRRTRGASSNVLRLLPEYYVPSLQACRRS
jgi:hypothetical protein